MTEPAKSAQSIVDPEYKLEDRYRRDSGRVFLTGVQALTRLPLMQARADRAAGLNTAGFISGYRGSPLGALDMELWRSKKILDDHDIRFEPGLNEDLAVTAVWGTQQLAGFSGPRVDGVFGMWYGKGPGVDRSADPLRHANMDGASKYGGVLALAGDDHTAHSSVLPHQTDQLFQALNIPQVNPSTVGEYLSLGLAGYALSRFSGLWVGFKCATDTVEGGAVVDIPQMLPSYKTPTDIEIPPHGFNNDTNLQWQTGRMELERRIYEERLPAAKAFWRANGFDRIVLGRKPARFGIAVTGKAYAELMEALRLLRIDEATAKALGLAIYKIELQWPLEPQGALRFADGLDALLVLEEKRSHVEAQLKDVLFHMPADRRPRVFGKQAPDGRLFLPEVADFSPDMVASALVDFIGDAAPDTTARWRDRLAARRAAIAAPPANALPARKPFFCSGCPHNTSTRIPDGAHAGAGIGCHIMAMGQGRAEKVCQMGGEGMFWVGVHTFTDMPHMFQNMGDGTYQHSGVLAIRQAVAAKAPMTFKILFNDAVAMTGGQNAEGGLTVDGIAYQLYGEGVRRLAVVSDEPEKYAGQVTFPHGTVVRHRDDLNEIQEDMRGYEGVSAIIYDQTCAAEKRRRRKRGQMPDPAKRIFINDRVCEGCGDCSVKSNCISVEPLQTDFGVKRKINQSSCNKDYSCVKGFCPSFISLEPSGVAKPDKSRVEAEEAALFASLPEADRPCLDAPFNMLVTGIGGTGVITIGALLSMAGHLEGKGASVHDHTGLAQKNGAVVSHVRLAPKAADLSTTKIVDGETDLLLACDMLVGASSQYLSYLSTKRTAAVVNANETPTADFVSDPKYAFPAARARQTIRRAVRSKQCDVIDATELATALFGDAIASNLFMVGYAWQLGRIPLSADAILRAIELNGVAVAFNQRAFNWGRAAVHAPDVVMDLVGAVTGETTSAPETFEALVDRFARELVAYQNKALSERYRALVAQAVEVDRRLNGAPGAFAEAVARYYYKVLAYKDEYEVARLYSDKAYWDKLSRQFDDVKNIKVYLAPPLLSRPDPQTGEPKKMTFGPWIFTAFRLMAKLKGLRGTPFDLFGKTAERKMERALIGQYERDVERLIAELTPDVYDAGVAIASVPDDIRGFGPVKERNVEKAREARAALWRDFAAAPSPKLEAA
ncbi:MAG: indolepyruvate ferredoxin oxidoreductase family protein [Pseudomonadota bacterium]